VLPALHSPSIFTAKWSPGTGELKIFSARPLPTRSAGLAHWWSAERMGQAECFAGQDAPGFPLPDPPSALIFQCSSAGVLGPQPGSRLSCATRCCTTVSAVPWPSSTWHVSMKSTDPDAELVEMPEAECLELLDQHSLGRVAVVIDGQPQIFPVNHAMSDRIIAFRTGSGTKLSHAPGSKVCFEIDEYDSSTGVGWSVMVQGVAVDATESFDDVSWATRAAEPWPLAPGKKPFWIGIEPTKITGRRFRRKA